MPRRIAFNFSMNLNVIKNFLGSKLVLSTEANRRKKREPDRLE